MGEQGKMMMRTQNRCTFPTGNSEHGEEGKQVKAQDEGKGNGEKKRKGRKREEEMKRTEKGLKCKR